MLNSEKGLVKGVVCSCYNWRGIGFLSVVLVFRIQHGWDSVIMHEISWCVL